MSQPKPKAFLFVDDNPEFLSTAKEVFTALSRNTWQITTAENHAEALEVLSRERVDVVVLDVEMPVMDGIQFLQLLGRTHPGQQVAMLTGHASEEVRRRCFENGAVLVFEKQPTSGSYQSVYAALDALAGASAGAGFHGMMRRVGLQEVLQLECLGRKSSVLDIFALRVRGRIYLQDGAIIHAETGNLTGEIALYNLLALQGGGFNLLPFSEPPQRTIDGHWEFLLMEAARLSDEGVVPGVAPAANDPGSAVPLERAREQETQPGEMTASTDVENSGPGASMATEEPAVYELLLCSGAGEVLHAWECERIDQRRQFIKLVDQYARELGAVVPMGRFEQLIIFHGNTRVVCQVRTDRQLFIRGSAPAQE